MQSAEVSRSILLVAAEFPPYKTIGRLRSARLAGYLAARGWRVVVLTLERSEGAGTWDESLMTEIAPGVEVSRVPFVPLELTATAWIRRLLRGFQPQASGTMPPGSARSDRSSPMLPEGPAGAPDAASPGRGGRSRVTSLPLAAYGWFFRTCVNVPDDYLGWSVAARREALARIGERPFDVVLTSLPPFSACLVGSAVSYRCGIPWVIDYRDLWYGDVLRTWMGPLRRRLELSLERHFVRQAALVVAVSEEKTAFLQRLHPRSSATFATVTNGYDPEVYDPILGEARPPRDGIEFVYTGRLFKNRRGYAFAEALGRLARRRPDLTAPVRVRILGGVAPEIRARWDALLAEYGIAGQVTFPGDITHLESMRAQVHCDYLLLIVDTGDTSSGVIPGKLFEYVAARRPIFALCDPGATPEIIERGRLGTVVPAESVADCEAALEQLLQQPVPERVVRDEAYLAQFERRATLRRMEEHLLRVIAPPRGEGHRGA